MNQPQERSIDIVTDIASTIISQMQKPTLVFLIGGMFLAATGSKFESPEPVCKFIVILLLLKAGNRRALSVHGRCGTGPWPRAWHFRTT